MAVNPKSVDDLLVVLEKMGYKVGAGHKPGQIDAGFRAAFDPALKDLLRIGINDDDRIKLRLSKTADVPYNSDTREILLKKIEQKVNDLKTLPALEAYAKNEFLSAEKAGTALPVPPILIKKNLMDEGFSGKLLEQKNISGVIEFFKHGKEYIGYIDEIQNEIKNGPAVAPVLVSSKPPTLPISKPVTPPATAAPPPVATNAGLSAGNPVLDETLRLQTQKFQVAAGDKWKGNHNGIYNQAFHKFLVGAPDKNPEAVTFYSELDMSPEQLELITKHAWQVKQGVITPAIETVSPTGAPATSAVTTPPATETKPQTSTPSPTAQPEDVQMAAAEVEMALAELGRGINTQIKERAGKAGMLTSFLFEFKGIPVLSAEKAKDGVFDRDSRESLQAVLKTFQADLELTDDEIYNYTPKTGEKIKNGYSNLKQKMSEEQQKKFTEEKFGKLVESLDKLYGAGQLDGGRAYMGSPIRATEMGATVLHTVFEFIGKIFPGARGLMDSMLMKLTGGFGYNELMPGAKKDAGLDSHLTAERQKFANLTPEQRIEKQYLDVLKDAKANNREGELKTALSFAVGKMVELTTNKQDQEAFKAAIDKAMAEAGTKADANEAAKSFATTFKKEWKGPIAPVQIVPDASRSAPPPAPPASAPPSQEQIKPDPATTKPGVVGVPPLLQRPPEPEPPVKSAELQIGASVSALPESKELFDLYKKLGKDEAGRDKLMSFRSRGDDKTLYVMGRNKDGILVAEKMPSEGANKLLSSPNYAHYNQKQIDELMQGDRIYTFPVVGQKTFVMGGSGPAVQPVIPGGETTGGWVEENRHLGRQNQLRLAAWGGTPAFIAEDFTNHGRVRFVVLTDRNGVLADKAYYERQNGGAPLTDISRVFGGEGNPRFSTMDITDEYARYMRGYNKFCDDNKTQLQGMGDHDKFAEYKNHLRFNKVDLEKEYPGMAAVIRSPEHKGFYYTHFSENYRPDIAKLAEYINGQTHNGNPAKFDHDYGFKKDSGFGERPRVSNKVQQFTNDVGDLLLVPFKGIKNLFNGAARGSEEPRPAHTMQGNAAFNGELPNFERDAQKQFPAAKGAADALEQERKELKQQGLEEPEKKEATSAEQQFEQNKDDLLMVRRDQGPTLVAAGPKSVFTGAVP